MVVRVVSVRACHFEDALRASLRVLKKDIALAGKGERFGPVGGSVLQRPQGTLDRDGAYPASWFSSYGMTDLP